MFDQVNIDGFEGFTLVSGESGVSAFITFIVPDLDLFLLQACFWESSIKFVTLAFQFPDLLSHI